MNIKVLGSSSSGNCYIIDDCLILEAGINPKEIKKAVNFDISKILGCLITHEHGDHSKYAKQISEMGINIFATQGTFDNIKDHIANYRKRVITPQKAFNMFDQYKVLPFDIQHDCADPVGYLIHKISTGETLLFATDTYYLKYTFRNLNYIMIECNYSEKILDEKESFDVVDKRRYTSHMSLETLKDTLRSNDLSKCSQIILLHLSDNNSDSEGFKKEIIGLTGINTDVAEAGQVYDLCKGGF